MGYGCCVSGSTAEAKRGKRGIEGIVSFYFRDELVSGLGSGKKVACIYNLNSVITLF